nr:MFS transporter [Propionibacterium cyclohexanicum]
MAHDSCPGGGRCAGSWAGPSAIRRTRAHRSGLLRHQRLLGAYNAYLPFILSGAGLSTTGIGAVMALDNVFGLTVQPLIGMVSDHTMSPWGRRIPFALFCAPVAAVALATMPFVPKSAVPGLIAVVVVYALVMAMWRAPMVALMPDLTESAHRSRANG